MNINLSLKPGNKIENMLIVTTSQSIIKIDENSLKWDIIESGNGLYYGIDFYDDKIYVAARKRLVSDTTSRDIEDGEIRVFNKDFNLLEIIKAPFLLRDMHQIKFINDLLFVTCTHDNMIAIKDSENKWEKWYPLGKPATLPMDINHFNSIEYIKNEIIINCHNHDRPSEILYFNDRLELKRRMTIGRQIHNYWLEKDEIFTNSSLESKIISTGGFSLHTGDFPRGYCNKNNVKYIGVSKFSERFYRDFNDGYINMYDKDWNLIDNIVLTRQGLVSDIIYIPNN